MSSENKIIVLGAGIAGISAAYHLKEKYPHSQITIFEKTNDWGGLCGGFYVPSPKGDFWFDNAVHLSFAPEEYVQNVFHSSSEPIRHTPVPMNYYKDTWIKHPAQNNLFPLSVKEKTLALKDMIDNPNPKENLANFEEWLRAQYGNYFAENFPMPYTRKYWTTEAKELSTSWVGKRLYTPNLEEILQGAMTSDTPNTYYAQEMRYPKEGQYRSFFKSLVDQVEITYGKETIKVDSESKVVTFSDGSKEYYSTLISTLPIPELVKMITNTPQNILNSASHLKATSIAIVSLGFNRADIPKNLWFYIYDEDKLFARVYSPSFKSPENAPKGCSSLQAEIYFSDFKTLEELTQHTQNIQEFCIQHVISSFIDMGICRQEDIICQDFRILPYGNVIFTHDMEQHRDDVLHFIRKAGILSCGRFGEWDYLWSNQSFLSGFSISDCFFG